MTYPEKRSTHRDSSVVPLKDRAEAKCDPRQSSEKGKRHEYYPAMIHPHLELLSPFLNPHIHLCTIVTLVQSSPVGTSPDPLVRPTDFLMSTFQTSVEVV